MNIPCGYLVGIMQKQKKRTGNKTKQKKNCLWVCLVSAAKQSVKPNVKWDKMINSQSDHKEMKAKVKVANNYFGFQSRVPPSLSPRPLLSLHPA